MKLTSRGAILIVTHGDKSYVNFLRGVLAGVWLGGVVVLIAEHLK